MNCCQEKWLPLYFYAKCNLNIYNLMFPRVYNLNICNYMLNRPPLSYQLYTVIKRATFTLILHSAFLNAIPRFQL